MGKVRTFFSEVKAEMQAVDWPNKQELRKNTITVIIVVAVFALFFLGVDSIIRWLLSLL